MPDVEALVVEHFTRTQELFQAQYQNIMFAANEQALTLSNLRKENEELRAQLGGTSFTLSRAWEASSRPLSEPKPPDTKPHGQHVHFAPIMPEVRDIGDEIPKPAERDTVATRSIMSLPGEVENLHRHASTSEDWGSESNTPAHHSTRSKKSSRRSTSSILREMHPTAEDNEMMQRVSAMFAVSAARSSFAQNDGEAGTGGRAIFADAASMKERVRQAILKPEYHVSNYYKQTGVWQAIARSQKYDHATMVVIFLNAIWIFIDTDYNRAPVIFKAEFVFQAAEHFFFAYFSFEWFVRFMAFETKRDCLRDAWFVFDSTLVLLMIIDGWIVSLIILATGAFEGPGMGAFPVIRILRLLRLTRMMRMARLLRVAPELMILIKGIAGATRSVGFTLMLLCGIVYIFAIAFKTITENTSLGERYFSSVPHAASTLFLDGTLPDLAPIVGEVAAEHYAFAALLIIFILLASLTVMNMLVGVLVEVVTTVSTVEKEQMEATFLKGHMLQLLKQVDEDGDVKISRDEFGKLLEKPKAIKALQEVGVDVVGLAELSDFIYKDRNDLPFPDFMETILQLRGTNTATVKSIVDMRMFMTKELSRVEDNLLDKLHQVIQVDLTAAVTVAAREMRDMTLRGSNVHSSPMRPALPLPHTPLAKAPDENDELELPRPLSIG